MRRRRFNGRLIGLLAAYLVALQALVLPLAMPPTAAVAGQLCLTDAAGAPAQHPPDQDRGCPCCVGCSMLCHQLALDAGIPAVAPSSQPQIVAILAPPALEAPRPPAYRPAQQPRAPPAG